jgi:hypothetical protein
MDSLATGMPRILLQRDEEIFFAVRESMASVVLMCTEKIFIVMRQSS